VSAYHPQELQLFERISCDRECFDRAVTCALRKKLGVLIILRGRPIGSWVSIRGRLQFSYLDTPHNMMVADDIQNAVETSITLSKPH